MAPPILNSVGEDRIYVKASQSGPAEKDPELQYPCRAFSIKRQFSVKFVSDDKNSPEKCFELPSVEDDELTLMGYEVDLGSMTSLELIADMLYEGDFIPFDMDRSMWRERHLNETIQDEMKSCRSVFDKKTLLENLRNFLHCVKYKDYNKGKTVLPVKLEIRKVITLPDEDLKDWNSYYNAQKICNPDFEREFQEAVGTLMENNRGRLN